MGRFSDLAPWVPEGVVQGPQLSRAHFVLILRAMQHQIQLLCWASRPSTLWTCPARHASSTTLVPAGWLLSCMEFSSHPVLYFFTLHCISRLTVTSPMKPSSTVQPLHISYILSPKLFVPHNVVLSWTLPGGTRGITLSS